MTVQSSITIMSTDRNKPKGSVGRPLMPRLATYSPASRSSTTPKLATPSSTTNPRLASAKSFSNLAQASASAHTPTPAAKFTGVNVTPQSTVRRPKLETAKTTPTSSSMRPALGSVRQAPGGLLTNKAKSTVGGKSVVGARVGVEKTGTVRGPPLARIRDTVSPNTAQTIPTTPKLSPRVEAVGRSFLLANYAPVALEAPRASVPPKLSTFVHANGEQEEEAELYTSKVVASTDGGQYEMVVGRPTNYSGTLNTNVDVRCAVKSQISAQLQSASPFSSVRDSTASQNNVEMPHALAGSDGIAPPLPAITHKDAASSISGSKDVAMLEPWTTLHSPMLPGAGNLDREECMQLEPTLLPKPETPRHVPTTSVASIDSGVSQAFPENARRSLRLSSVFVKAGEQQAQTPSSTSANPARISHSSTSSEFVQSPPTSISEDSGIVVAQASNARRDRKVLDLEISNSSLLAINSSLEREVRKQKVELRRYRRLTRNNGMGYLLADASSNALGDLEEGSEDGHLTDEEANDDNLSENESSNESLLSSEALARHDAKHRKSDVRLMQLDLSKHRELLVDSQRMNQSLGRCMGLTEQLLKDANKALNYRVRTSDIQLGGRVLAKDDDDQHMQQLDGNYDEDDVESIPYKPPRRDCFGEHSAPERPQRRIFSRSLSEVMKEMF